jgi:hypothetical protein
MSANKRINNSEQSMLKLSEDIGKMADRIGVMADRILETQKIQNENIKTTQESIIEMMKMMNEQLKANQKILELIISKGLDKGMFSS